jgi:hypothetical protein
MSESAVTTTVARWTRQEAKDMRAVPFDRDVLRALVDYRFSAQGMRKGAGNQIGAIERRTDTSPDSMALRVLYEDFAGVEKKADRAIEVMVESHEAGRWAVSIPGIAHTFAGVLLAYVDVRIANTAGKLWRFFGVDPTCKWEKGKKRPYCALGKTLVWQIGESFKKLGADHPSLYAKLYRERKALEIKRNDAGMFREQALARLELLKNRRISPLQRETWGSGKLQPIGLDMRAGRYAAKLFLSHFHHVLHEVEMGCPPPVPYILGPGGHADFIAPPNWPMR